ncbi:hypothetical protein MASR2M54_08120 [Aliarcobacter cryaerophilus]
MDTLAWYFWGIAAAGLNVTKLIKELKKCMKVWKMHPRYSYRAKHGDKSFDDDEDK